MGSLLPVLQQWFLFTGTLLIVGCVAWRWVVASRAGASIGGPRTDELRGVERKVARTGLGVALFLILVWGLRMVVQLMGFRDPFVPLSEDLGFLIGETFWGTVWVAQGAILPLLALTFWLAGREGSGEGEEGFAVSPAWLGSGVLVVLLVLTLSLSSHAMGVEEGTVLAVTADGLHALTGGAWIGSLALILVFGRGPAPGSPLLRAQLRSFSPMAVGCVTLLVAMGVALSWVHLGAPADLWRSRYGQILSAKILLAGGVLLVGLINWRKGIPSLDEAGGEHRVRRQAAAEVLIAVGVLLLTALLTQTPKPGEFGG